MIDWYKRMKREDSAIADRKVWRSRCGRYRVEEVDIRYGRGTNRAGVLLGYPIYFRAMIKRPLGWDIVSEHRKRAAAFKQLEYHNEHSTLIPKKKKKKKLKKVKLLEEMR